MRSQLPFLLGAAALAALAALAGLAACTDAPRRPLDPDSIERELRARSLSDPALRDDAAARLGVAAEPWPPPTLDLALLTLAAWRFRPELAVARAEVAAAEAKVTTAGAWSNPRIASSFGRVDDSVGPPWFLSAALDFTIPTAGKVSKREAVASQEVVLARLAAAQAAWRVYAEVRDALLEASVSARELDLARREAQVRATLAAQAAARVAAGAAASTEELLAQVEADRARAGLAQATAAQAQARARLAAACGLPVAELEAATLAAPAPAPALETGSTANDALLDRLDVRVVVAEYEAA
jgi:outer membrane protein TolC